MSAKERSPLDMKWGKSSLDERLKLSDISSPRRGGGNIFLPSLGASVDEGGEEGGGVGPEGGDGERAPAEKKGGDIQGVGFFGRYWVVLK